MKIKLLIAEDIDAIRKKYEMLFEQDEEIVCLTPSAASGAEAVGLALRHHPDVILMDDGFQHRSVQPSLSILLSSYNRLMTEDALLPAGRLREPARGRYRADVVVVTKCPTLLKPIDCTFTERKLDLYPHQKLLFSEVKYEDPVPIFRRDAEATKIDTNAVVIALSGISHPEEFFAYL